MSNEKHPDVHSCGFLIVRDSPKLSFLLMKHAKRWDLPKGHVDAGESEIQCALRELWEETGIAEDQIEIDINFRFDLDYDVRLKRYNGELRRKRLTMFLAKLTKPVKIELTEHQGFAWFDWDPPHSIQPQSIDPLLEAVEDYWDV